MTTLLASKGLTSDARATLANLAADWHKRSPSWGEVLRSREGHVSWEAEPVEPGEDLAEMWLHWDRPVPLGPDCTMRDMVRPGLTAYGDYIGDTVNMVNYTALRDLLGFGTDHVHPGCYEFSSGYGYRSIVLGLRVFNDPEVAEFFDSLASYCVADEDALTELEHEQEEEAVAGLARDFIREVAKVDEEAGDKLWDLDTHEVEDLVREVISAWYQIDNGPEWEHTTTGAWTDPAKLAEKWMEGVGQ